MAGKSDESLSCHEGQGLDGILRKSVSAVLDAAIMHIFALTMNLCPSYNQTKRRVSLA